MNKKIGILVALCGLSMGFVSCEDDAAGDVKASMTINKTEFEVNESMEIVFTGAADAVSVWTGDEEHDYELRDQNNSGFAVNKGRFSYSYTKPGIYKVVLMASTYNEKAVELRRDTCSYTIKVIDDHTAITKLSCPQVFYDEVFATAVNDTEWLMELPRKLRFKDRDRNVTLSQRLKFYIPSELTTVAVNGEAFGSTKKYDISAPVDILVTSDYGTTRDYKLYTMYYPEFKTFSIAGVNGTIVRDEFNYNDYQMDVVLPAGTDVSSIAPVFTTYSANEKVYIGDVEQTSGVTRANFADGVTYRLVSTFDGKPELQSESTFRINISYK